MEKSRGLRKGAWTHEEDELLKGCIKKYGEGKWHLVPKRAGLNRCRKSCRLRWLNYLNPNINRKSFSEDEVDMMLRLHKLLGNRWSLIAGRLPGRTANDVKNYWHTHLSKKVALLNKNKEKEKPKETMKSHHHHEVIKPQPRTFSSYSPSLKINKHDFGSSECASTKVLVASNELDATFHRECEIMLPIGDAQPSIGDDTTIWLESLWNLEDQVENNEKINNTPNSLMRKQKEDSILEFAKDFFSTDTDIINNLDFSLCDVDHSILDL